MVLLSVYLYRLAAAEYYWSRGSAAYKAKQYAEAATLYGRAIDHGGALDNEHLAELYCDRGDAYDMSGDLSEALKDYDEAIRRLPTRSRFYYERAIANRRSRRYQQAVDDTTRAIQLSDGRPRYYFERAQCLMALQQDDRAVADFDKYISMAKLDVPPTYGRDHLCYEKRGWIKYRQGKLDEALADLNQALKVDPTCAFAYRDRATIHRAMGRADLAARDEASAAKYKKP